MAFSSPGPLHVHSKSGPAGAERVGWASPPTATAPTLAAIDTNSSGTPRAVARASLRSSSSAGRGGATVLRVRLPSPRGGGACPSAHRHADHVVRIPSPLHESPATSTRRLAREHGGSAVEAETAGAPTKASFQVQDII